MNILRLNFHFLMLVQMHRLLPDFYCGLNSTFSEVTKFLITAQEKEDKVGEGSVSNSDLSSNMFKMQS